MSFSVIPTGRFKKEAKRLSKKFPSLKEELAELSKTLTIQPDVGTPLATTPTKSDLESETKGKGKVVVDAL